jgi:hypothetical protein
VDSQDSGSQQSAPLPVDTSVDALRIFFDTDDNPFTGYQGLDVQMGADSMIEITGHFGIITQRVIKDYTGDGDDFAWGNDVKIDAAAAGSEIELEASISGSSDSYYIHLTGWDGANDFSAEADNDPGSESSDDGRGAFAWPTTDTDGTSWTLGLTDSDETNPDDDVDIWKIYHNIGVSPASTDHTFFMIVGPGDREYDDDRTYAVMLDFNQDGTYDKVFINDPASDTDRYGWHTWSGSAWSTSPTEDGSDEHAELDSAKWSGSWHDIFKFAIDDNDFNSGSDDDSFFYKVVTIDDDDSPFSSGETWASTNSPTDETANKDFTVAIPEFPSLLMPVLSVVLISGLNYRKRKNEPPFRPAQS